MRKLLALMVALVALAPRAAAAFCGFYVGGADAKLFNNATLTVLMRDGTRTVLSMQNNYEGPPSDFAMVVPVPVVLQKDNVKTLPHDIFARVDASSAPRLVEYWEQDPCPKADARRMEKAMGGARAPAAPPMASMPSDDKAKVRVEAEFTVGEYEIVILSADDALALDTWLHEQKYNIPEGAAPVLKPYVQGGMKFFVAKVNTRKVTFKNGQAQLSPLRFHYDSETFTLPVRLGLLNSKGTQDLIVHVLARGQRYEVANYPNVTIPTNLDVSDAAKGSFGAFYASLFDATVKDKPGAVVTEYAWDTQTCDPCPGPALTSADILTLGADVIPANGGGAESPSPRPGRGGRPANNNDWARTSGFVTTRLHARYSKDTLGQDLVFKAAPAIVGGREIRTGGNKLERGAAQASTNNFQGRYAIRHEWQGPINCPNPVRGVWGGGYGSAQPATNLAFAPRDQSLSSFLRSEVPEIGLTGLPPAGANLGSAVSSGDPVKNSTVLLVVAALSLLGFGFWLWWSRRGAAV